MFDFSLPEGMSLAGFKKHPVTVLVRDSAHHGRRRRLGHGEER